MINSKRKKLVYGFGINDADYPVDSRAGGAEREPCKFYIRWHSMIQRCYSEVYKRKYPTYEGCSVCPEWKYFSVFKAWMEQQDWEGKELDKDLLVKGNKIYSPETCVFISPTLNYFLNDQKSSRGELPLGVTLVTCKTIKYQARCNYMGKSVYLGSYWTPQEAHLAWLSKKNEFAKLFAEKETDERIIKAILSRYI